MAKKQVVTRDEFEAFLANPNGEGSLFEILRSIPEAQRQLLFDVGKSVCKIANRGGVGSGFHLGGGWIKTALHVISDVETMGAEYLSDSTFQFPNEPVIAAASRSCIFPMNSAGTKVKDLTLIHVPELIERASNIPGLGHPFQEPPKTGDCVHLVHFGGDHQQFSINGNVTLNQKVEQQDGGNSYSTFMAYSPSGSSGAPLLIYREDMKTFLVVGVHYEGPSTDDAGDALWFSKENWLKYTLRPAVDIVTKNRITSNVPEIVERHVTEVCEGLEEHLREHHLRVIINRPQPEFVKGVFQYVTFKP